MAIDLNRIYALCVALPDSVLIPVQTLFTNEGIEVHVAANQEEAVDKMNTRYYDVLIFHPLNRGYDVNAGDGIHRRVPIFRLVESTDPELLRGLHDILISSLSPDWSYFEQAFPDDPQIIPSLKIELK